MEKSSERYDVYRQLEDEGKKNERWGNCYEKSHEKLEESTHLMGNGLV